MIRLSQIANGDEITRAERTHPAVQLALRRRFRRASTMAVLSVVPTAIGITFVLWPHSNHAGLLIVLALVSLNALMHAVLHLRLPIERDWTRRVVLCQLVGGASWGLLPWLASPTNPVIQTWVAALLLGILASNTIFGSQFAPSFYAFQIAATILGGAGLFVITSGVSQWAAVLVLYGGAFSAGLAHMTRGSDTAAAVFAVRSGELAAGLAKEQGQLRAANDRLAVQARSDALTGLANRLTMTDELEGKLSALAVESSAIESSITLAYLDLDRFKMVNDAYGHRVGDLLLISVAKRLTDVLLPDELLTRHGGDELTVVSCAQPNESPAELGERLRQAFEQPFVVEGLVLDVGVSIGVATAERGMEADELIRWADAALYRAKNSGGDRVAIFGPAMKAQIEARTVLEQELVVAFETGDVVPYLQPVVDIATGAIVGAEALARWEHESGTRVAGQFIDAVHDLGMLDALNRAVVGKMFDFRVEMEPLISALPWISVNVAPHHLEPLLNFYADTPVFESMVLEITEGHAFSDMERACRLVEEARSRGASVVLDDFGIGYSSLSIAVQLDVDGFKIDRQFVQSLGESDTEGAAAVVAGVVAMARYLGRRVTAEGVETVAQLEMLRELGVDRAQGFLFARAIPLQEFADLIVADHRYQVDFAHLTS